MFIQSISAPYPDRVIIVHNRVDRQKQTDERPKEPDSVNHSTYQEFLLRNSLEQLRDALVDVGSRTAEAIANQDELNEGSDELLPSPKLISEPPTPNDSAAGDLAERSSTVLTSATVTTEFAGARPARAKDFEVSSRIEFYDSQAVVSIDNQDGEIQRVDVPQQFYINGDERLSPSQPVSRIDVTGQSMSPTSPLRRSADRFDSKPQRPADKKLQDQLNELFSDKLLFEPASEKFVSAREEIASILVDANFELTQNSAAPADFAADRPAELAVEFPPSEYDGFYFADQNLLVARLLKSIDSILARTEPVLELGSIVNILA